MELLSKSDKIHLTAGQTAALGTLLNLCEVSKTAEQTIQFTPTQEWIDRFAALDYFFYADYHTDGNTDRPIGVFYWLKPGKKSEPWVPQNGEIIHAKWSRWYRAIYIGPDTMNTHVVRSENTDKEYRRVTDIRKWQKTQVPLAELLSVYASVKGLTQDGVELKPEN